MAGMEVVLAKESDLALLEGLYARARAKMKTAGNPTQWKDSYPPRELLLEDIRKERLYLMREDGELLGAFVFFTGTDPAYRHIDGKWLTENREYGVVHRVAANEKRGFLRRVMDYCSERAKDIRIDTHEDNAPMRGALEKLGFTACGTVIVDDGTERIAFEKVYA